MIGQAVTLLTVLVAIKADSCNQLYVYDKKAMSSTKTPIHKERTLNRFECGSMLTISKQWLSATFSEINGCQIYNEIVVHRGELQDQEDSVYVFHHASSCLQMKELGFITSGIYNILLVIGNESTLKSVHCDMITDRGGWTVFQRRQDGKVDFYLDWESYSKGFGNMWGEFWLGSDLIHDITSAVPHELRVDLEDFSGNHAYAKYDTFSVGSEQEKYKLNVSGYSGTAGDSLTTHNGMEYSTKDSDNDISGAHCAVYWKGAWWYKECTSSHLNGLWGNQPKTTFWSAWKGYEGLKFTSMMIRLKK